MAFADIAPSGEAASLSLESTMECIALEANFLTNMVERLRDSLPSFATNLKESISSFAGFSLASGEVADRMNKSQKQALNAMEHLNFVSFSERTINVPEGFKGKYLPYAQTLNKIVEEVYKAQLTVIPEYSKLLSQFLTNKDDKLSLKDHTNFYHQVAQTVKHYQSELDAYKTPSGRSKASMKSVVDRFADMKELFRSVNRLTDSQSKAQLRHIQDEVQHCVDLLDMIIEGIQKKTITTISPEAAKNISVGAFEVARYIRFISQVYFTVDVFLNMVEQMTKTIAQYDK